MENKKVEKALMKLYDSAQSDGNYNYCIEVINYIEKLEAMVKAEEVPLFMRKKFNLNEEHEMKHHHIRVENIINDKVYSFVCPRCLKFNISAYANRKPASYCQHCGQAIDWSEEEG